MVGKWHLGDDREVPPDQPRLPGILRLPRRGPLVLPAPGQSARRRPRCTANLEVLPENEPYTTDTFAREALAFIDRHAKDAVVPVPDVQRRPRADARHRKVPGPLQGRAGRRPPHLLRDDVGHGRRDRRGAEKARREQADREHADLLRQRQRRPAGQLVEQRRAPRQQGPDLGRGHPRAVPGAVEGHASGRQDVRSAR